jgi:hypothetical protein
VAVVGLRRDTVICSKWTDEERDALDARAIAHGIVHADGSPDRSKNLRDLARVGLAAETKIIKPE